MDVRFWLLIVVILMFIGCKTTEVTFVAKYQRGPASIEVHGSPSSFSFK